MHDVNPIELTNGSVTIGGRPILRGIDLTVEPGQFVALMGANGSGKSTLVRALVGLWPLSGGDLRIYGSPIASYDEWSRVGFVPQRASAESGVPASVWEVVSSGRLTHRRPFRPMSRADRPPMDRAIEVVGLQGKARDGISSLSGGQQQRALIARALAGEPDLFFLDEPTAGVDLPNQQALGRGARPAVGPRRHHRAGRPRARATGAAGRAVGGHARRPDRLRRAAARRPRGACAGVRRGARAPPPPDARRSTTTCRTCRHRSTGGE